MMASVRLTLVVCCTVLTLCACAPPPQERVIWPLPPNPPRLEWLGTYASQDNFPKSGFQLFLDNLLGKQALSVFQMPFGIAADGHGIVYVADSADANLRIYDLNRHTVNYFSKDPIFDRPMGLDIDADGNLYVVDGGKHSVLVFDRDRRPLRVFGSPAELTAPVYVKVDAPRDRVYVSDSRANRVVVYNRAGVKQGEIGPLLDSKDNALFSPQGMAIDKDGNLFIAEVLGTRISVVDAQGKYLRSFGERGDALYQFEAPKDLAFDSEGNLWVVDNRRPQIYTYTPEGVLLLVTGEPQRSAHALGFVAPTAIFIAPDDTIYISDRMNRRFSVYRYLSQKYLAEHPFTPAEEARLKALGGVSQ